MTTCGHTSSLGDICQLPPDHGGMHEASFRRDLAPGETGITYERTMWSGRAINTFIRTFPERP